LDAAIRAEIVHAGFVELLLRGVKLGRGDRDGQVLDTANGLHPGGVLVPWEIEEAEQVVVADVEEEVIGALVIAVLNQFDERAAEELLVELDRLLRVAADQRQVMYSLDGRRRPVIPWPQVLVAQFSPTRTHPLEFLTFWLWHRYLLVPPWSDLG